MGKKTQIGHSLKNEKSTYKGGKKGDQTGKEILIAEWYLHTKGWIVIRAKDPEVREKLAQAMEMICQNDNFGYCQDHRLSGFEEAAKVGYDPSKVKVKCELDCSQAVRLCLHYAGIKCENFRTRTQEAVLRKTGKFEFLTSDKYCKSCDYLLRGDILLTAKVPGHTIINLTDGDKIKGASMGYTMKTNIAHRSNYGATRSTSKIKYIVIHFTANDGDSDEANAKYFKSVRKASAHYFVDGDSVTQSVYDNYVAYSVGGSKYSNCSTTGGGKYYGKCTNSNSISIELCDCVKNGTIYPNQATINNALELTKELMKKYNVPKENVIRHFDVTGKTCPGYWAGTAAKNAKWKTEFWNKLSGEVKPSNEPEVKEPVVDTKIDTVKEVQSWVNKSYAFEDIKVDGVYGNKTKAALVKALQTELNIVYKAKLTVDGAFGSKTKAAIKTIKPGAYNDMVKVLQALLVCNGYKEAYVDGDYGKGTENAVKDYKKKKKFTLVNGNAGSAMFASLCK